MKALSGYELLTQEQREELDGLSERRFHSSTSRFSPLDEATYQNYQDLMGRLERESQIDANLNSVSESPVLS